MKVSAITSTKVRQQQTNRTVYMDNVAGLCILNMIFAVHLVSWTHYQPLPLKWYSDVLFFFMFWFFFKGGCFFRRKPLKTGFLTDTKRLLIPYIIFNAIGVANEYVRACLTGTYHDKWWLYEFYTFKDFQCCWTSMACWFLLSLFIVRCAYACLCGRISPVVISIAAMTMAFVLFSYNESCGGGNFIDTIVRKTPYWLGNVLLGLSLFSLGHYLRARQFHPILFSLAVVSLLLHILYPSTIDMRANSCDNGFYLAAVCEGIAGCIVIDNIARRFLDRSLGLLTYIGRFSMIFYLSHYPAVKIIQSYNKQLLDSLSAPQKYFLLLVYLLIVFLISWLLYRYPKTRFIFGG